MNFQELYKTVTPRLKGIARSKRTMVSCVDDDDLYQEMTVYLWNAFKNGLPQGTTVAYAVRGCEFHILNYLRKVRTKASVTSLEKPINENNDTLMDVLSDEREPLDRFVEKKIMVDYIRSNGFSKKEKKVFALLLEGHTMREVGRKLGISHVMVIKHKDKVVRHCREKIGTSGLPNRISKYFRYHRN